ncbi:MAG: hypothetical protein GY820_12735 [Gammaproteobacteria bacterium]|nr:hypothetical protein [Gammaproteobacteria bacterium]
MVHGIDELSFSAAQCIKVTVTLPASKFSILGQNRQMWTMTARRYTVLTVYVQENPPQAEFHVEIHFILARILESVSVKCIDMYLSIVSE